jgi:hypothetical protein
MAKNSGSTTILFVRTKFALSFSVNSLIPVTKTPFNFLQNLSKIASVYSKGEKEND